MINTKAVKTRIKSVKNTKKITRAMQMIAAVKMKKAVETAISTREYSTLAYDLMENLSDSSVEHPLAKKRKVKKVLLIIFTSNRGLCGGYNSNVLKEANKIVQDANDEVKFSVVALGKKAAQFAKKLDLELIGLYEKLNESPNYQDIVPIAKTMMDGYLAKDFDEVRLVYTNYISGLNQEVNSQRVLPFSAKSFQDSFENAGGERNKEKIKTEEREIKDDYDFEPNKKAVLDYILPILIETQVYQALLESTASEHSSRMIAMKNATDAAGEMIDDLTLEYNKGRQAAITQEISEIVAGAAAL